VSQALRELVWLARGRPRMLLVRCLALTAGVGFALPIMAHVGLTLAPAAHGGKMLPGTLSFVAAALFATVYNDPISHRQIVSVAVFALAIALPAYSTPADYPGSWTRGFFSRAPHVALVRFQRMTLPDATWPSPC
jgi:hypothetical protein